MKHISLLFLLSIFPFYLWAQHPDHEHHTSPAPMQKKAIKQNATSTADTTKKGPQPKPEHPAPTSPANGHANHTMHPGGTDSTMQEQSMAGMPTMSYSYSRNLPMTRNGSGTSWMPDATPMYAYMKHTPTWNYMFHGAIFPRYTHQNIGNKTKRGSAQFGSPNWFMLMAQRPVGQRGLFSTHVMLSLDILTEGGNGYPLLFQSGETFQDQPLIDRQHPHDLFSEVSIGYTHMLNQDMDVFGYLGFPGEPALGPPAFMHRISAYSNPDATLGHHWQDATHIVFGVSTLGFRYKNLKLEGSAFTGREPNENRFGFDKPRFDSYSYRVSANPSDQWSLQFSQAYLKSPEILSPNENVNRTTASALYSNPLTGQRNITASVIWGLNKGEGEHVEHSFLTESNLHLNKTDVYGRYEFIQKSTHELALPETEPDLNEEHGIYNVHALTLGASRVLARKFNTDLAIGVQGTLYAPEKTLQPFYGKQPVSGQIYLRITPSLRPMNQTGSNQQHHH